MKLSLDPIDRIQEKGTFMSSSTSRHSHQELFADKSVSSVLTTSGDSQGAEVGRLKERRMSDSATQTGKSLQSGDSGTDSCSLPVISADEIAAGWSPSEVCQLNTPPSSQMSPSTSNPDLLSSYNIHSHCSTPGAVYTPGQSPTTSLGGDIAYHHGYSSSPSVSGSRGKSGVFGGTPSGRGTPVRGGKASSHDGQLTRAVYSALAQHSHESAPAAIGGHHTSTPKEPVKFEEDTKVESPVEASTNERDSSPSGSLITFEAHGEETKDNFARTSSQQFDSGSYNILPKQEYRDLRGQQNFASEVSECEMVEPQQSDISSDHLPDSLTPVVTPVEGQSLDAVTLANSPSYLQNVPEHTCTSADPEESQDATTQSCSDFDGSSTDNKELYDQQTSTDFDKGQDSLEVNKSETSLASYEASLDSSKFRSTTPLGQQNHQPSHSCELITAFPQLLNLIRGEQEYSGTMSDVDDQGFSRLQQRLLSCGPSPVEILDSYLKTGNSVHYGELSRYSKIVSITGLMQLYYYPT